MHFTPLHSRPFTWLKNSILEAPRLKPKAVTRIVNNMRYLLDHLITFRILDMCYLLATSGSSSVSIVRLWTKGHGVGFFVFVDRTLNIDQFTAHLGTALTAMVTVI
jgi:hypothetical protein